MAPHSSGSTTRSCPACAATSPATRSTRASNGLVIVVGELDDGDAHVGILHDRVELVTEALGLLAQPGEALVVGPELGVAVTVGLTVLARATPSRRARNHWTATMTARMSVGASPTPHAISPARCWSARGSGPQGRLSWRKKSGASRASLPVSATPKNAWNEIVAKRMTRSMSGLHRGTPGSMPMSTHVKRYPVRRKWAIISRWPVWVVSDSSNRPVQ